MEPGHYVPHFEAKGEVSAYLAKSGQPYTVRFTSHATTSMSAMQGLSSRDEKTCCHILPSFMHAAPLEQT